MLIYVKYSLEPPEFLHATEIEMSNKIQNDEDGILNSLFVIYHVSPSDIW